MAKDEIAYLGSDTIYEGRLSFKGSVRIEGKFTGDIVSEGTLNIGKDAVVRGTLAVGELLLSGHFSGDVFARRRAVLYSTGVLEGNIQTPRLLTEEGAVLEGKVSMRNASEKPAKKEPQAIEG